MRPRRLPAFVVAAVVALGLAAGCAQAIGLPDDSLCGPSGYGGCGGGAPADLGGNGDADGGGDGSPDAHP